MCVRKHKKTVCGTLRSGRQIYNGSGLVGHPNRLERNKSTVRRLVIREATLVAPYGERPNVMDVCGPGMVMKSTAYGLTHIRAENAVQVPALHDSSSVFASDHSAQAAHHYKSATPHYHLAAQNNSNLIK